MPQAESALLQDGATIRLRLSTSRVFLPVGIMRTVPTHSEPFLVLREMVAERESKPYHMRVNS